MVARKTQPLLRAQEEARAQEGRTPPASNSLPGRPDRSSQPSEGAARGLRN